MRVFRLGIGSLILALIGITCTTLVHRNGFLIYPAFISIALAAYWIVFIARDAFENSSLSVLLDDERIPVKRGWTVVRNATDFKALLAANHHRITRISFDHDLGHGSESGMDCLRFLIDKMMGHPEWYPRLQEIVIHSANRTAAENMYRYAFNAKDHVDVMRNVDILWLDATVVKGHVTMPENFDYTARN